MKVFFLLVGLVFIFIVITIARYSMRLGQPVNAEKSDNYYHHRWEKKIIYSPMGNWFELGYSEMDADPVTFVVLDREFAKDKNAIYWKGKRQHADVATFYVDEKWIPKDHHHAYYLSTGWPDTMTVVQGANPTTYEPYLLKDEDYNPGWFRDDHAFYLEGHPVEVDFKTFQRLNRALSIDTNFIYITLSETDKPNTLVKSKKNLGGEAMGINNYYARVGTKVMLNLGHLELITLDFDTIHSVAVLDDFNIIINNQLVSRCKLIPEADVTSLEILPQDYLRDRQHVFYFDSIIPDANPATFKVINLSYSKDQKHVFYQTRILHDANPEKFIINFAEGTASDGIRTYREGELIK
jgi:DKNYY family